MGRLLRSVSFVWGGGFSDESPQDRVEKHDGTPVAGGMEKIEARLAPGADATQFLTREGDWEHGPGKRTIPSLPVQSTNGVKSGQRDERIRKEISAGERGRRPISGAYRGLGRSALGPSSARGL